jgi:hypothetical protein
VSTKIASRAQLDAIIKRAQMLPSVSAKVAARAAERMSELAAADFDAKQSVYGVTYGVGRRSGTEIQLNRTGRMRALALRYMSAGRRVSVSLGSLKYARFLLGRFWFLPKRGVSNVPTAWNAAIREIAGEELKAHFTKAGA